MRAMRIVNIAHADKLPTRERITRPMYGRRIRKSERKLATSTRQH